MQAGAEKYAAANTDKFDFKAVGMKDERDFAAQVDAIENFVTQKYDVIVVAPGGLEGDGHADRQGGEGRGQGHQHRRRARQGRQEGGGNRSRLLRSRQPRRREDGGRCARPEARAGGKVVILEGNPEADNAVQRKLGFMDSVNEGKLQLLDSKTAHWETEEANTLMTNFLTQYHDIQGVMAANDSMALGVVKALDAAGSAGRSRSSPSTTSRPCSR